MLQIFAVQMKESVDRATYDRLLNESSIERQRKAQRFVRYEDAARSLIGERLTREVIAQHTGLSAYDLRFAENEYGKPHVVGLRDSLYFNVSHSEDWIVCAIDIQPVGIDVERIKPIDLQIAHQFFSEQECTQLMSMPLEQRLPFFLNYGQ